MWSLSHWLVLSHTTTSPVWSIAAFTQRVITAGPDRWPHRSLENSPSDARRELINCWNHNLGIWLKEPFYSVRKHGSSPALWEGIIIRKSLKGVLTDGLSYTCRSWNTGFRFFALVSLSHSREFPGLFVFFPTTQKFEQVSAKFARRAFQICKIPQQFHIKTPTLAENVQRNVTTSSPQIWELPQEVDIRGQGEWKWKHERETVRKNMVILKRNQEKFQMGNRGPIWNRVAVTLRQDRVEQCGQEKEKGMHKGKRCGADADRCRMQDVCQQRK